MKTLTFFLLSASSVMAQLSGWDINIARRNQANTGNEAALFPYQPSPYVLTVQGGAVGAPPGTLSFFSEFGLANTSIITGRPNTWQLYIQSLDATKITGFDAKAISAIGTGSATDYIDGTGHPESLATAVDAWAVSRNMADQAYVNDPNHITQDSTHRFVTDSQISAWNGKESAIAVGTALQYWDGTKTWQTFPTNLSSFTNGPGYITASALSPYVTSASLTTILGGYATTAALGAKFDTPTGNASQYLRGDGSAAAFPSIPAAQVSSDWNSGSGVSQILNKPTNLSAFTNGPGYITGITGGMVTAALGYTPLAAEVDGSVTNEIELPNQTGQSGKILGTNGSSPSWVATPVGTVTSVNLTSSNLSVSGGPVTGSGSITVNLPNTGTAGTYDRVTTDAQGRVTAGATDSYSRSASRSLNSSFQVSTTRKAHVYYQLPHRASLALIGGQRGDVFLETSPDNATWTQEDTDANGNTSALVVAIGNVSDTVLKVQCLEVQPGYWIRIRSTGTGTFGTVTAQELLK